MKLEGKQGAYLGEPHIEEMFSEDVKQRDNSDTFVSWESHFIC